MTKKKRGETADKWDKIGLAIAVAFFIIIGLISNNAFGASRTVDQYFGETKDSVYLFLWAGSTVTWSDTLTDVSEWDTTFSLGNDTLWLFGYRYFSSGVDSAGSGYEILLYPSAGPTAGAPWPWRIPLYWDFATDSVHGYLYRNGGATAIPLVMEDARTSVQSYDTVFSVATGVHNRAVFLIYPSGGDSVRSYSSELLWDTTGSGSTDTVYAPAPSTADNVCNVWGYIVDGENNPIKAGATVTFTLPKKVNNSCDSTILMARTVIARVDPSTGYFQASLTYSSCLDDTDWQMTVSRPRFSDIERKVTVPDSSTYQVYW